LIQILTLLYCPIYKNWQNYKLTSNYTYMLKYDDGIDQYAKFILFF